MKWRNNMNTKIVWGRAIFSALLCLLAAMCPVNASQDHAAPAGTAPAAGSAWSASKSAPNYLNYQGFLADAQGQDGVTATLEMTFKIYAEETGGTELWSETHPAVQVSEGLFSVLLGSLFPIPGGLLDGSTRWLQTEVDAEILVPRKPLVSVAYSLRSQESGHAQTSDHATYASDAQHAITADTAAYCPTVMVWTADGDDIYRPSGRVGIGLPDPAHTLDVAGTINATTYYGDGSNLSGISAGCADDDWTIDGENIHHLPGRIGIGTDAPEAKLHVESDSTENALLAKGGWSYPVLAEYNGPNSGAAICAKNTGSTGDALVALAQGNGRSAIYAQAGPGINYAVLGEANNADWAGFFSGDLHTSGRVGIGTTSPQSKLDIDGDGEENALMAKGSWSYPIMAEWGGAGEYAALLAKNTGSSGDAIQAILEGGGRSAIYAQGVSGADYAIMAAAGGATWAGYLSGDLHASGQAGIGTTSLGGHQLSVASSGSGQAGATVYAENDAADGIAMALENTSSDVTLLLTQNGAGDMMRCETPASKGEKGETIFRIQNDGRIVGAVLELTGGSDLAEPFDISSSTSEIQAGMLVCIDPHNPGKLVLSSTAYDRTVAGIISGAGQVNPGMIMGQAGSAADGQYPVALTGRVYCRADASNGAIRPGDLLTSSHVPGYAMKVTDHDLAQGAIIGKAMSSLEEGQGLVLVLVTLQ